MPNRLATEPSPYLRQHEDNPVDWWPWGDEAFEEAKRRDVPVFLSVGYATCHWCHVMAHESFEDGAVAALLNDAFVCVKVDREERPDIDATYMATCQAMNGRGGWPLTAVLDHQRRPWFTGTYFPKTTRGHHIGMMELVPRLHDAWTTQRAELEHSAQHLVQHLATAPATPVGDDAAPTWVWYDAARAQLATRFDTENGGFGGAPKFPSPHQLTFLLHESHRTGDDPALAMVRQTLHAMLQGGLHDHVGGGFHRYSTDAQWLLPHFEKMLYDQATLLSAYTKAWRATGDPFFQAAAHDIVGYVLRDLRHSGGGFFCAEDADSEGEEGRFYFWTLDELQRLLGDDAEAFLRFYGVEPGGNFHDEQTGQRTGANILHMPRTLVEAAQKEGVDEAVLQARMAACLGRLHDARSQRVRPLLDDKILTDWNGLMLGALADAGAAFARPAWTKAAARAADFVWQNLRRPDGGLRHRFHDGVVDDGAFLDDYAYLADGLVRLFQASQDPVWLRRAVDVADAMLARFASDDGRLNLSPRDGEEMVLSRIDAYDGALPSGNSIAVGALWALARLTGRSDLEDTAWRIVTAFGADIARQPSAFTAMLEAAGPLLGGGAEVVIAGEGADADALEAAARRAMGPGTVLLRHRAGDDGLAEVAPWLADYPTDKAAAYVCRDHACEAPVTTPQEVEAALRWSPASAPVA